MITTPMAEHHLTRPSPRLTRAITLLSCSLILALIGPGTGSSVGAEEKKSAAVSDASEAHEELPTTSEILARHGISTLEECLAFEDKEG